MGSPKMAEWGASVSFDFFVCCSSTRVGVRFCLNFSSKFCACSGFSTEWVWDELLFDFLDSFGSSAKGC